MSDTQYALLIRRAIDAVDLAMKYGETLGPRRDHVWMTLDEGNQCLHNALRLVEHRCSCGRIRIGMETTDSRNWNPDCAEHGVDSDWWKSDEQTEKRRVQSERLRDLQAQARAARARVKNDQGN